MTAKYLRRFLRFLFKTLGRLLLTALLVAVLLGGWLATNGWLLYRETVLEKSLDARIDEVRAREEYITLEEVPSDYPVMVVAVEDQRFYEHGGFDLIGIGRAVLFNLRTRSLTEGGSTITQQLAKNLCFTQEKTLVRKAAEIFAALELERQYSKTDILELYINTIYYGSRYTGLEAAAQGYFGIRAAFLSPVQCTLLVGLPQAPSVYTPDNDPARTLQRQAEVVDILLQQELIDLPRAEHLKKSAPSALNRWMAALNKS